MSYSNDFTGPYLLGLTEAMAKTDRYAAPASHNPRLRLPISVPGRYWQSGCGSSGAVMFRKPKYNADDLASALTGLETLERLRDKTEQAIRLIPASEAVRRPEYDRYTQAIKSRQKLIIFIQESIMK
jgi:hypothetical protein